MTMHLNNAFKIYIITLYILCDPGINLNMVEIPTGCYRRTIYMTNPIHKYIDHICWNVMQIILKSYCKIHEKLISKIQSCNLNSYGEIRLTTSLSGSSRDDQFIWGSVKPLYSEIQYYKNS